MEPLRKRKNLSKSKIKRIEGNLLDSKKSLFQLRTYYDYDDIGYKGISDVGNYSTELDAIELHSFSQLMKIITNQ